MKTLILLLCTLALVIFGSDLLAQDLAVQNSSGQNQLELIEFFSNATGIDTLKNAIKNPDGTNTIKAGQQTPEATVLNRKICANFGANDVTNEIDITLGPRTPHAGACVGPARDHHPGAVQSIAKFGYAELGWFDAEDIEAPPCFTVSTMPTESINRNFAGQSTCTSPLIHPTYSACYGVNCTINENIDGEN